CPVSGETHVAKLGKPRPLGVVRRIGSGPANVCPGRRPSLINLGRSASKEPRSRVQLGQDSSPLTGRRQRNQGRYRGAGSTFEALKGWDDRRAVRQDPDHRRICVRGIAKELENHPAAIDKALPETPSLSSSRWTLPKICAYFCSQTGSMFLSLR